ncbi:MAG: sulfite exporter TauE/SafE family protein [Chloroflexi bacterium]|nr:sulfite exporter TauE/SafE family protein [Chloroflexota bacterium]
MSPLYGVVLLVLGLIGGTLSGLLGIGGGLIIVPLLLYVPLWFGFGEVGIRTASAVAVVQVTAATLSGALAHRRHGGVHLRLALVMTIGSTLGALLGGILSAFVSGAFLLVATAALATMAAVLMFLPSRAEGLQKEELLAVRPLIVVPAAFAIGLVIGMNGSGAFLMLPMLIYLVGVPTRIALGTVLAVGFPTAFSAAIGKVATGQVPFIMSAIIVVGAIIGAQFGSALSVRATPRFLRWAYGVLVSTIAIGLWYDVLTGLGA